MKRSILIPSILFFLSMSHPQTVQPAASESGLLLVANQGSRDISIVDPATEAQVATVPENMVTGHEVAASPDGKIAYVPIYGNSGVGKPGTDGQHLLAINIAQRKIIGDLDFGHGVRPHCAVWNHRDNMLYVTTELDKTVSVIDPNAMKVVATVPTGQDESHMLAISSDGKRGYTANVGPGTVSVLDLVNLSTVTVIPISGNTQRISITPDNSLVFTADQTKPQLAVIDTATNKIKSWIPLSAPGYGTTSTHDGKWLLVCVPKSKQVAVVDLNTLKVVRTIDVPAAPQEVLVRPDGQVAYVSCNTSAQVAAIDLNNWTVLKLINAGKLADGLAWANAGTAAASSSY